MSNDTNTQYLEHKYEEGLDMGMSEQEATQYAHEQLEENQYYPQEGE
tara:strand:+ start:50 stop:190 length:141 start_codon:yes stop_codon:yes gene_type:complete